MTKKLQVESEFLGWYIQWPDERPLADDEVFAAYRVRCENVFHTEVMRCKKSFSPFYSDEAHARFLETLRKYAEGQGRMMFRFTRKVREISEAENSERS